jgi:hypothetical protein
MVGIPSALMAALFYRLALPQVRSIGWAVGLTLLLCFGTVVWPYSLVLNHHLPAAIALFVAFYLLFADHQSGYRIFWAGLLAGTAVMLDLTSIFLACPLFLIVTLYHQKHILFFIGAALIPVVATVIFNYQITGSALFAYFSREGYIYPGSPWDTTVGGQHPPDNILLYAFRSFIGDRGLFAYSPLLLFAAVGLILVVSKSSHRLVDDQMRGKSALILLGIVGHLLFILTRTNNFGGDAYGWRFLIPFIPILCFFIVFTVPNRFYERGSKWVAAALWIVAAWVSVFSAYQGVRATWHQINPPLYVALLTEPPYMTVKTNLILPYYEPSVRVTLPLRNLEIPAMANRVDVNFNDEVMLLGYDLPARRVEPGQNLQINLYWQSLRATPRDYFVFTHLLGVDQTRQGGLDRRLQEGYPIASWYPGEIVTDRRQIPVELDAVSGLAWLRVGGYEVVDDEVEMLPLVTDPPGEETSIAIGPILIGTPSQLITADQFAPQTALEIELGDPPVISLRGYDLVKEDDTLRLTLYWESSAQTSVDWTTFTHLRDETGVIVAQQDGPTGGGHYPTSFWNPGELVADEVALPIDGLPNASYSLFIGLYDLSSETRLAVQDSPANEIKLINNLTFESD